MVEKKYTGRGFIVVYRLAIDAKTLWGDDEAGGKYPSLLEDFQTGTASMARKRHLASSARGFYCFCLMAQIEVQWVQEVQEVQEVQNRLIRGRIKSRGRGYCLSPHAGLVRPIRGGRSIGPWLMRGP